MFRFASPVQKSFPLSGIVVAVAAASALTVSLPAEAVALRLGPLTFSEAAGNFALINGRYDAGGFVLQQEVYGPDINLFIAVDGFRSACGGAYGGCYFPVQSFVTNRTGTAWNFFDHELQEIFGIPSPEADGLSFTQGVAQARPFASNYFARADEVTDVRDFINFSGGTVLPNETVVFNYWISDTSPLNRFYLLQRPNYQVGVGFVNPTPPIAVVPDPVVSVVPDPVPVTPVEPVTEPSPPPATGTGTEPDNSAAVPEPSTMLGLLLFGAIAGKARLNRSQRSHRQSHHS